MLSCSRRDLLPIFHNSSPVFVELGGGGCWRFTKKLYDTTLSIPPPLSTQQNNNRNFTRKRKGAANKTMSKKSRETERQPMDVFIGRRIKYFRSLRGVTQKQLGDMVGVRFQQVQKYETGASRISASRLYLVCNAFEITIPEFFLEFYKKKGRKIPKVSIKGEEELTLPRSFLKLPRKKRQQFMELVKYLAEFVAR